MFAVTLLCAPGTRHLDEALPGELSTAWGGTEPVWLAPGEAAEFLVTYSPGTFWEVWSQLQERGIDIAVQPAEGRRRKLLLADMDSTMIAQECIDELAAMAGIGAHVAQITARAMNGELDFEAALRERVALLEGLEETVIEEVLATRITLAPGGPELVATMRANGAHAALVSGGFTAFTADVAARLGFDEHRANVLLARDGKLSGQVAEPILGREAKITALEEICARLGIAEAEAMAVGDGANDLGMLGRAGAGVALHAKPAVAAQTDLRINFGDLTALLYLQGYRREEFSRP
ncbi:phosphoserine phosphatase SerB [Profundibacterium mesophilum]|uniref:Phosphoserine phosphatase n=1 Tax=Profundibacterium mesophilum KAUST100406-0324 TaxID=1037889 RepID=A0A921TD77_9RHOB|nr:phosphoserine phosphatase SerB [Profundibacterium mesophilum]KAF0676498.1 Phosphoserine phosphatase [Profundibacterium mesophilum KAUST100406-0324]